MEQMTDAEYYQIMKIYERENDQDFLDNMEIENE